MPSKNRLVNLDAMIRREDFAFSEANSTAYFEGVPAISIRELESTGLYAPLLRKPDFQRETNHWDPEQVVSLLECFVNGDLIPSVILWKSASYWFVIDGGHRISVLRAWVEDDYGDGPVSKAFLGDAIPAEQKKAAEQTRQLVSDRIGTWLHVKARNQVPDLDEQERRKISTIIGRTLPIQWVQGNAEKAEASFFKINTKGTPLDDIEELLLVNRRKPIPIASRAVIRAGMGHKYWSAFGVGTQRKIEKAAVFLHKTLFEPELTTPVKTLDLPLGGSKGVRVALQVLIEYILIANQGADGKPVNVRDQDDDQDGIATTYALDRALKLAKRLTGNDGGSLGLHPAIYFYGPGGRHSAPLFLGTSKLLASKLSNNDPTFFRKFSQVRSKLESLLIKHKELIATIQQRTPSKRRVSQYAELLDQIISQLVAGKKITDKDLVGLSGLVGKVLVGSAEQTTIEFSDDIKTGAFISSALGTALKCPICNGYLDPTKSLSYDHKTPVRTGGRGGKKNVQLTHPYCNQSIKS